MLRYTYGGFDHTDTEVLASNLIINLEYTLFIGKYVHIYGVIARRAPYMTI